MQLQEMKDTPEVKALRRFLEISYEMMLEDLVDDAPPTFHARLQGKAEMTRQLNDLFDKPLAPGQKKDETHG